MSLSLECTRTICAFANDIENQDGGYILIGVEEKNGRPVLPVSSIDPEEIDKIEKDLLNKCHFIEPFFLPRIEKYQIDDKYIVVLWVTAGQGRPNMASKDVFKNQSNKAYYIRHGSQTIQAEGFMLKELFENFFPLPLLIPVRYKLKDNTLNNINIIFDNPFLVRYFLINIINGSLG